MPINPNQVTLHTVGENELHQRIDNFLFPRSQTVFGSVYINHKKQISY